MRYAYSFQFSFMCFIILLPLLSLCISIKHFPRAQWNVLALWLGLAALLVTCDTARETGPFSGIYVSHSSVLFMYNKRVKTSGCDPRHQLGAQTVGRNVNKSGFILLLVLYFLCFFFFSVEVHDSLCYFSEKLFLLIHADDLFPRCSLISGVDCHLFFECFVISAIRSGSCATDLLLERCHIPFVSFLLWQGAFLIVGMFHHGGNGRSKQ